MAENRGEIDMTELKPCPFCGGEAVVDKYPVRGYEPAISFEVRCSKCGQRRVGSYVDTVDKSENWARRKAIKVWNERPNPWHTGIPTEEGDYLCWVKGSFGIKHGLYYNRCKYKDGNWFDDEVTNYNLKNLCFQVIAWQKIEPYKEKKDGRTD